MQATAKPMTTRFLSLLRDCRFKLATPYVVANQARVTFAGRSEPVPRRTTTSGIRDALQVAYHY